MPIISLTTDLGLNDHYLASVKARLHALAPSSLVIDVNHHIEKHNISEAAYCLSSVISDFPPGSIHVVSVDGRSTDDIAHLLFSFREQWFIVPDNGIAHLLLGEHTTHFIQLNIPNDLKILHFPLRDLYVPAAAELANGKKAETLGLPSDGIVKRAYVQPMVGPDFIRGSVIYTDGYGNAITNITRTLFERVGKGRTFLIGFRRAGYELETISVRYSDAEPGDRLALFSDHGNLEIAINMGHAAHLLGLTKEEIVIIQFDDHSNR